ncbi:Ig-like domain-containing protein [Microbacterium aquimaris]|uniref:Ig-like domain-containing protein n=1 Tax=Microbacterium aquimaris TaxID=459816 RepID=UPI002AD423D7|nr:Ig-like domain-containing protein [Microbacterium aquimaris]MDZ8274982.1 Ig-like domain-containing protein [Microbacterium aquimaris]
MRRRTLAGIVAGVAAAGVVLTAGIVWPGLDAQETPPVDPTVWALQTGEGSRYARVNTAIGELDTVRTVSNPSEVAQGTEGAFLFSDSWSKITRIDAALPTDLDDDTVRASPSTPAGTTTVAAAGDFVAYLTDAGTVFAGELAGDATQLDPFAAGDDDAPPYTAEAIAVAEDGTLFAYSAADGSVLRWDIATGRMVARDRLEIAEPAQPRVTAAGDTWAVVDGADGTVWLAGVTDPLNVDVTGAVVVGRASVAGSSVYIADETSLVRVPVDGSTAVTERGGTTVLGVPAAPVTVDGEVYAAWLPQGDAAGLLWSSVDGETVLDYAGETLGEQRRPQFVVGQGAVILNETRSGWVWTVPDGQLVPSSQNWALDDTVDPESEPSEEQLAVQIDPKPPIAEPDAFGVRAGALTALPVLLNDHDPNEDVLAIDPASVTGLDPDFGTVGITDDGQRLTVQIEPGATGAASFSYAVTDGTVDGGLTSDSTTVTVTVAAPEVETAPRWCGVEGCLVTWPTPEVARGGTVTVPVMPGWVDPEGDPMLLLSVENPSGVGNVAATPAGEVVYQHDDDGGGSEELVELRVTVADTLGQTATKSLLVRVSPQPQLTAQSFAVVDSVGSGVGVDVLGHVTGTAGALSLESVRVLDDAAATATVVGGSTTFDVAAEEPGTYRVDYTVTDGDSSATATARITLLAPDAPADLTTAPVVAFVHPQEDATLDVFAAVSNPTGRVLLLSDVEAAPEEGATLSVDAVGQNYLRVSGSTATGEPGTLGTVGYTVSDGTQDGGARVRGEATVYLLPPAPELAPIAVDDTVVVRTGAQVDIPVLENDVAPSGGRPVLNPASVVSSTDEALAFASGDTLRYLAPDEPGRHTVEYSASLAGAPGLEDTATVRIEVLDADANRAPSPDTLEARVLSGETTRIPFDGFGMDPDGDVVRLDAVISQPESGSATISADGTALVYSSVAGDSGQDAFRYRVVDDSGQTGEGTVRVGVLDSVADPSPVTFTDYVQVQVGAENVVRVDAVANDLDPTGGDLSIRAVRPDQPTVLTDGSANPEYARLDALVDTDGERTLVIRAGEQVGTMAFLYDVVSTSGNTGRGLVVVTVVREAVPDYPIVEDTVLTVETREDFVDGVDVLTGKTAWSGGDVGALELALWGDPDDVEVGGSSLRGALPERTRIIPFEVTGQAATGEVVTYAFLRVPGDDDLELALRAGVAAPEVTELESVTFDLADHVALPRGAELEVGEQVRAAGARPEAQCRAASGTQVTYDAGAGAPFSDACQVPVRLVGQTEWTYLSVPVTVIALDPQPELAPASVTVGPGETDTFDLREMTSWQLREDWDGISYAVSAEGSSFDVSLTGSVVTVTGADDAVPGRQEAVIVSVTSHPGVASARLLLRVGAAPSTLPRGGSVTQQCSQASGGQCTIEVVGAGGEVNPLPGTPLEVVDVTATGACTGVTFAVADASRVVASWSVDAPGATCAASFSVRDAQGRVSAGERDGNLLLDLQGYPRAPASVTQTAFADGSLTLRVDPGSARQAYPALTGFVVRSGGQEVARCGVDGTCPAISAPNGEQRAYEVRAVNAVGESRTGVGTTAWAYDPPPAPDAVTATPVATSSGEGGVVAVEITGISPAETGSLRLTSPSGDEVTVPVSRNQTRVSVREYRIGTNTASTLTVTPLSRFDVPPGLGGSASGSAVTVAANGIGAPQNAQLTLVATNNGDGTATIVATGAATVNGQGSTLRYDIVEAGRFCRPDDDGARAEFEVRDGEEYAYEMCVESRYDGRDYGEVVVTRTVYAVQDDAAPRGYTFVVDARPDVTSTRAEWRIRQAPASDEDPPRFNDPEFNGYPTSVFGRDPGIDVRYVHDWHGATTGWADVTARAGSAPYQVQATWSASSCVGGGTLQTTGSSSTAPNGGAAAITFGNGSLRYFDADGTRLSHTAGTWEVPVGAAYVEGISVTVDWSAQGWGLQNAQTTFAATCQPGDTAPETPAG